MITVQQAYDQLRTQLQTFYGQREAAAITAAAIAHIAGFDNTGRLINKHKQLTDEQAHIFHEMTRELLLQKPLQYVLHEASFYGMKLYVDENVLIPRPETEELVDWIIKEIKKKDSRDNRQGTGTEQQFSVFNQQYSILDVGTGSGCIPIALKKHLPFTDVHAADISEKALDVAKRNAATEGTLIDFHLVDILDEKLWKQLRQFDIIVSNPPYITQQEAGSMHNNVLQFEPHIALFVPDEKPLIFYEAIATFGLQHLNSNGLLFFEINETYGAEICKMLISKGYQHVELRKDMQGKARMIKATLLG